MSEIETHWHHAPIMLDVLTPDGRILYANATQERILGHEAGALNGTQQEKLYPKTTRALLQHYFAEAARGRAVGAELVRIKMRGRDRRFEQTAEENPRVFASLVCAQGAAPAGTACL